MVWIKRFFLRFSPFRQAHELAQEIYGDPANWPQGYKPDEWLLKPTPIFRTPARWEEYFWLSVKLDKTPIQHALIGLGFMIFLVGPFVNLLWWFNKEWNDGQGMETCVGVNKCKQGFDIFDFLGGAAPSFVLWIIYLGTGWRTFTDVGFYLMPIFWEGVYELIRRF